MKRPTLPGWAKWLIPGLLAAGGLMAASSDGGPTPATVAPARPARGAAAVAVDKSAEPSAERVELERLAAREPAAETSAGNAFAPTSWFVPPPPPPVVLAPPPPPPPPPSAPPLPFAYLGRYEDKSALVVILTKGDRVYTVVPGDVIDGVYRVERTSVQAVELTYLPLKIPQTLGTGGA